MDIAVSAVSSSLPLLCGSRARMHNGEHVKEARQSTHPVDLTVRPQADDRFLLCVCRSNTLNAAPGQHLPGESD